MLGVKPLGPTVGPGGVDFAVWSSAAQALHLCLFDGDQEISRLPFQPDDDHIFRVHVEGLKPGARYGVRAEGPYAPDQGLWFDPDKLLLDPYATRIDKPFAYHSNLSSRLNGAGDTAAFMPKGVVEAPWEKAQTLDVGLRPERVIYELQVRAFSKLHPQVPVADRGTLAALSHPAIIDHLKSLHVGAVELMPINAWIDERHLAALGLSNAWGYNPVSYFALDPRLAPGGMADLRKTVAALHEADIAVFMDVVYNHNGESDFGGPTLSFRGLDPKSYFRHAHGHPAELINDTGCGNTLDCTSPVVRRLVHDSLRYFVEYAGIDGFRFDLAPILGRDGSGFNPDAPMMVELLLDPVLGQRILVAEPWDIGPGGYQLGGFPSPFLEWNDRYRDDVRRFWRGDAHASADLATRLAGSSDVFAGPHAAGTRTVNFVAAHDGFSVADTVSYEHRHNHANGEENRDGHSENLSWNNGVEGVTDDAGVLESRRRDIRALLSTLFVSRGHILLTAGDEFGRTQAGNNNAYAQDNELTWLDWENRDLSLQDHAFSLARMRVFSEAFSSIDFLQPDDITWILPSGREKQAEHWDAPDVDAFAMAWRDERLVLFVNRSREDVVFRLNDGEEKHVSSRSIAVECKLCNDELGEPD